LLEDYGLTETPADERIREELNREADSIGTPALHARLNESDPEAAAKIHPNDRKRIIRALEVLIRTGAPISEQQAADRKRRKPIPAHRFVLYVDRDTLDGRIEARVHEQLESGLEKEVRALLGRGLSPSLNSLRSLGYKEMAAFVLGDSSYEDAIEAIKYNTRRFARRQITWFRAEKNWTWIDVAGKTPEQTAEAIKAKIDLLPQI
jgi:tRNA dimethylallyltransferase